MRSGGPVKSRAGAVGGATMTDSEGLWGSARFAVASSLSEDDLNWDAAQRRSRAVNSLLSRRAGRLVGGNTTTQLSLMCAHH